MSENTASQIVADENDAAAEHEAARVGAVFRLTMMRERHPDLGRREADARIELTAAIIAMDEAEEAAVTPHPGMPLRHTLHEQAAVERAKHAYAQALADLVRGDA